MKYIPKQGDIIWIDFNPQLGHEQKGRRPALVIWNNKLLNKIPGMSMVCAITNKDNGFPLHVKIKDVVDNTQGFVCCEQCRVLDLEARNAEFKGRISDDVLDEVINILSATIEKN